MDVYEESALRNQLTVLRKATEEHYARAEQGAYEQAQEIIVLTRGRDRVLIQVTDLEKRIQDLEQEVLRLRANGH